jgi:phosphatidate cytidylyltransferase
MTEEPAAAIGDQRPNSKNKELFLRINSALVLGSVSLVLAYRGPLSFAVLIAFFMALMAWEWGRLVRGKGLDLACGLQTAATAGGALLTALHYPGKAVILLIAATAGVFILRRLNDSPEKAWWSAAGVYYAGLPAVALVWLRADEKYGWAAILFLFIIVWTTDTAAYAVGRTIGGPKLAPEISPGKTWAGLIGGVAAASIASVIFACLLEGTSLPVLGCIGAVLSLVSQMGDLAESAVKRIFGFKDTSGLIPGHGGVLDRLDGLVAAAGAASLLAWAVNPAHPGAGLLIW